MKRFISVAFITNLLLTLSHFSGLHWLRFYKCNEKTEQEKLQMIWRTFGASCWVCGVVSGSWEHTSSVFLACSFCSFVHTKGCWCSLLTGWRRWSSSLLTELSHNLSAPWRRQRLEQPLAHVIAAADLRAKLHEWHLNQTGSAWYQRRSLFPISGSLFLLPLHTFERCEHIFPQKCDWRLHEASNVLILIMRVSHANDTILAYLLHPMHFL